MLVDKLAVSTCIEPYGVISDDWISTTTMNARYRVKYTVLVKHRKCPSLAK